jgi:dihydrofolate synthase/folylpolyglutamate synthase
MLADKDVEAAVRALSGQVARWYCGSLSGARGQAGEALARRVRSQLDGQGGAQVQVQAFPDVAGALSAALDEEDPAGTVLVFGSFQTVAEALELLEHRRSSAG